MSTRILGLISSNREGVRPPRDKSTPAKYPCYYKCRQFMPRIPPFWLRFGSCLAACMWANKYLPGVMKYCIELCMRGVGLPRPAPARVAGA
jgi:hypothetical protein